MLYALDRNELKQLRNANWTAEFTGAEMLAAVFRNVGHATLQFGCRIGACLRRIGHDDSY
jgi:hypothetical protein